jgi:hypothetical protein
MLTTSVTQPYFKRNCGWPVRVVSNGWDLLHLALRYEAAVKHFIRTPKGSLWRDLHYGTSVYKLRAQDMDVEAERPVIFHEVQQGFSRYLPDLSVHELSIIADHEDERRGIAVVWTIRGANRQSHGELGQPRKTEVLV